MANKKTILYIGGFELPDKNAAAQRVLSNAKILRELGFNVILIGVDKTLPKNTKVKETKFDVQGFETWSVPYPTSKVDWFKQITSIEIIKQFVEKKYQNDLYAIITYNYPAIAQYKIKNLCIKYRAFYIADVTEWHESSGGGILFNSIKWFDTSLRMRFSHLQADGIITISKYLTNFYTQRKCLTVELPTLFDVETLSYFDTKKINNDIIKLMYAGSAFNLNRVDKNRMNIKDRLDKIILMLYKVYQQKKNFTLDIYGLTQDNYLTVFPEHTIILEEISTVITFHGKRPHQEIVGKIQKSDFTIFLRNIERVIEAGFPTKFSESISYGTPVISNMISNIENYSIEGKSHYIINLDDEEAQVEKMVYILSLSKDEIMTMKNYCLDNKLFDYRNYLNPVKKFLEKIEGQL